MDTNTTPETDQLCQENELENPVDDIDECDDETDDSIHKFSSPEASASRLAKLLPNVLKALQLLSEESTFNTFLSELRERYNSYKSMPIYSFERMWHGMVFSYCMNFRNEHYHTKFHAISRTPQEVVDYMRTTSVIDILQTLVDLSQQNGYHAKQLLDNTKENYQLTNATKRDYNEAQNCFDALQQRYHEYVDLFRHCTGTWKPSRRNFRRYVDRTTRYPNDNKQFESQQGGRQFEPHRGTRSYNGQESRSNDKFSNKQYESHRGDKQFESRGEDRQYKSRRGDRQFESRGGDRQYESRRGDQQYESRRSDRYNDKQYESRRGDRQYESRRSDRSNDKQYESHRGIRSSFVDNHGERTMPNKQSTERKHYNPGTYHSGVPSGICGVP